MRYSLPVGMLFLLTVIGCGGTDVGHDTDSGVAPSSEAVFSGPGDAAPEADGEQEFNTETYDHIVENAFVSAKTNPLSTFSIDVDTASYANVRRILNEGRLPPPGAVRIEEFINYFKYFYPQPEGDVPFWAGAEIAACPWKPEHRLVSIAIKGREIAEEQRPAANIVFLLDVSGSMNQPNKLPLVKSAMKLLIDRLNADDRVAIAVYASASGLVLPSTSAGNKEQILFALNNLSAGGSTNGGEGIQLAYDVAAANFVEGGINRVILCTDGDFNIGITDNSRLVRMLEERASSGVFLSVLGFGTGNYKDSRMEELADKGNGNAAYIDTLHEARKVLVEQMTGTLITIAKDVKIQVDFNPAQVNAYRLIGYENRMLQAEDFRDDKKDAGEIGAGHTVTALYEVVPVGVEIDLPEVEPSKYQRQPETELVGNDGGELLTVRLRYKLPDADKSKEIRFSATDAKSKFSEANTSFRFTAAVAAFGMLLRDSQYKGSATFDAVAEIAQSARGNDPEGYRSEFLQLVKLARDLKGQQPAVDVSRQDD